MKVLLVYMSRKQMCDSPEQAIEFINSLHSRNMAGRPLLVVNETTEKMLRDVFASKWEINSFGQPFIHTSSRIIYGYLQFATTNCGNTTIYGYMPLGDTLEEHERNISVRNLTEKKAIDERIRVYKEKRMEKLSKVRKGSYSVSLIVRLMVFNDNGSDYFVDTKIKRELMADSGIDAYNAIVKYILDSPEEIINYGGHISVLHTWSELTSEGYKFHFNHK